MYIFAFFVVDWYSIAYPEAMTRVITKRKAALSEPYMIPRPDNPIAMEESKLWCEYFTNFIARDENCMEPMSTWHYPIIDDLKSIKIADTSDYPDAYKVVAMIAVEFYWRSLIEEILPPGSKGIILVFENPCVPDAFTYQIDGPKVKYLGVGDFHDREYDSIAKHTRLDNLNTYRQSESAYMGLPLDQEECDFTFHVYPSDDMKDGTFRVKVLSTLAWLLSCLSHGITMVTFRIRDKQRYHFCSFSSCIHRFTLSGVFGI